MASENTTGRLGTRPLSLSLSLGQQPFYSGLTAAVWAHIPPRAHSPVGFLSQGNFAIHVWEHTWTSGSTSTLFLDTQPFSGHTAPL